MDKIIEKTKAQKLKKYWPWIGVGCLVLGVSLWLIFGNHALNAVGRKRHIDVEPRRNVPGAIILMLCLGTYLKLEILDVVNTREDDGQEGWSSLAIEILLP